jgi:ferredoxin
MAPFMVIGETIADFLHIPRFRLRAIPDDCASCGKCNRICPMGLNVSEMVNLEMLILRNALTVWNVLMVALRKQSVLEYVRNSDPHKRMVL